jgi:hypothetical protein
MKYLFGSMIVNGSGRLGGNVYSRNHYGSFVKTRVSPKQPNTTKQVATRVNLKAVQSAWDALTDAQRSNWNVFSKELIFNSSLGFNYTLTGYHVFLKCNLCRLSLNYGILIQPDVKPIFPYFKISSVLSFSYINEIVLFLSPSIPAGYLINIFATKQLSQGINYVHGQLVQIGSVASGQTFPTNVYSLWFAKFAETLTVGLAIFFEISIVHIASGLSSNKTKIKSVILSGVSNNIGVTYSNLGAKFSQTRIYSVAYITNSIIIAGSYPGGKILRSVDNGLNWSDRGSLGSSAIVYCCARVSDSICLAGTQKPGEIFRSSDAGLTWSKVFSDSSVNQIVNFFTCPDGSLLAAVARNSYVLRSTNSGLTWSFIYIPVITSNTYNFVNCSDGSILSMSNSQGILIRSYNYGLTWISEDTLFSETKIWGYCYVANGIVLLGSGTTGNVYRSVNNGKVFTNLGKLGTATYILRFIVLPNFWVIALTGVLGTVYLSKDFGLTWSSSGRLFSATNLLGGDCNALGSITIGSGESGYLIQSNP